MTFRLATSIPVSYTHLIQAMGVIDVDNFKHINDNYGHDVGDIILQSIAQSVLSSVRKTDAVIRYGGDEFIIIFFGIPADIFEKKLERIRHTVDHLIIDEHPEPVSYTHLDVYKRQTCICIRRTIIYFKILYNILNFIIK